ncbi:hypothetical protein [Actinokineospora sp.]|uniref:hypothetical protein n=1 Tax=Actinokineospora sp. TaxID=1872133 RepID=UPI004037E025
MAPPTGENIDGFTDHMEDFKPNPPQLGGIAGRQPMAGGGGMLESGTFANADRTSTTALVSFMTQANQGMVSFATIAQACAADYARADGAGAQAIVSADYREAVAARGF